MPEPATSRPGSSAIALLEEAVNVLRRAPLSTWLLHWTGAVPLVLAWLLFWHDATQYHASGAASVADAALLAVALAWMNSWRALYAGRLRSQLSGEALARPRIWRMAASQTFLGATKLIVLPLAALVIFPLAPVAAFYRYATALAAGSDLDAVEVIARASRLARYQARRSWAVALTLAFVQLAVTLNVALTLLILPQLVKMLTGFESVFSRSGMSFAESPLFAMTALAASWLAVDPFLQAAYGVMCFHAESIETGEDLRVALRRIVRQAAAPGAAGAAAAVLLTVALPLLTVAFPLRAVALPLRAVAFPLRAVAFPLRAVALPLRAVAFPLHAAALPLRAAGRIAPERLRQSIEQAVQSHEYDWRFPPAEQVSQPSWLTTATEAAFRWLSAAIKWVGHAIGKLIEWIFDRLRGLMPTPTGAAAPETALHWSLYLLLGVILALVVFLAWRLHKTRRAKSKAAPEGVSIVRLEDESLTPDRLAEEQWLEMAETCLSAGDFRLALRAFYLANLAWLGRNEWIAIHPGKTNREYARELSRRARGASEAQDLFARNLSAFERAWYGLHEVNAEEAADFRKRNQRMKALLPAPPVAREAAA